MKHFDSTQTGFSLIEVTVAAAIFSMGLAGLSLLLLTAVMGTRRRVITHWLPPKPARWLR